MTRDPLAVPIPCTRCRATIGYANRAKVASYRRQFGGSLMTDEGVTDRASDALALRCPSCYNDPNTSQRGSTDGKA